MNKLMALRDRMRLALVDKCAAITDERTGGKLYVLAFAWLAYCYDRQGTPRTFIGNVRNEWRAERAYRLPR